MALWFDIYQQLDEKLNSGNYAEGELFSTVGKVAQEHSVSIVTANRALRELSKRGKVRNIPHKGCVVTRSAPKAGIYLIPADQVEEMPLPVTNMQKGIFSESTTLGLDIRTATLEELLTAHGHQPGIVLFLNYTNEIPTEALIAMLPKNLYPVCIGSYSQYAIYNAHGSFLHCDYHEMARQAVLHFHDLGCRRIGYLGKCYGDCFYPRFSGYMAGLKQCNLPFQSQDLFNIGTDNYGDIQCAAEWLKSTPYDAIFTSNLESCLFLKKCLAQLSISPSPRIASIGFSPHFDQDVDIYFADYEAMGRLAIQLISNLNLEEALRKKRLDIRPMPYTVRPAQP